MASSIKNLNPCRSFYFLNFFFENVGPDSGHFYIIFRFNRIIWPSVNDLMSFGQDLNVTIRNIFKCKLKHPHPHRFPRHHRGKMPCPRGRQAVE